MDNLALQLELMRWMLLVDVPQDKMARSAYVHTVLACDQLEEPFRRYVHRCLTAADLGESWIH